MSFGFSVRVLVLSLLAFGHNTNALYRSGGPSGTRPLFAHPRSHNPDFVSTYERSVQPGGFLGSSGSSHGGSGQVDGYSPYGSVSSYVPEPQILRKQNSQQPPKTNPNANGRFSTKGGNWDLAPQNGKSIKSGIASSSAIIMQSGSEPHTFNPGYLPKQPRPQEVPTSNTGYPQKPPRPQQLPIFNMGYLQKPPQQLPTSNTGSLPRPQQLPTSNTGNLHSLPRPQQLPTSNTGNLQRLPKPQQL
uniref:Uncharacterized protein n=2 Tax=Gasterosteus aculeatus TaxID=69293 RepID=G3NNV2_GASAC